MSAERVLSGKLDFLSLAEVLQLLSANGSTGILVLKSPYATEPGIIYFVEGNLVHASCPSKKGIDAAYALFGWTEGDFEFTRGEVKVERAIKQGLMEIVMDGVRMLDDDQIPRLGPSEAPKKEEAAASEDQFSFLPMIKRPVSNYGYVVDEEEVAAGEYIVREGMHGNWICVLLEGFADVIRETPKGPLRINRLGPGALLGNISSMLSQKSVRTASLISVTSVTLGVLDLQRIHTEFAVMSFEMRQFAMSLDKRLRGVTDRVVETYLDTLDAQPFLKDRKPVLPSGPEGEGLFEITEGTAALVRKTEKTTVPLVILEKGDYLGQVPFLNIGHEPHNAQVLGSENCVLKPMDEKSLKREYQDVSSMIKGILDHLATCIGVTTSIACDFKKIQPRK